MRRVRITRMLAILPFFITVAASCKFPELPALEEEVDAAPDHSVGGMVSGLWTGANLTLRLVADNATPQLMTLSTEGAFTFSSRVAVGASFTLSVDSSPALHACVVENPRGQVQGLDIDDLRVHCTSDIAVSVSLSSLVPFTFDPQATQQNVNLSILQGQVAVTATGPIGATTTLEGMSLPLATPSAPIALELGINNVLVEFSLGTLSRRYQLRLNRGGIPAGENKYAKSSDPEAGDTFGASVSASRDVIAVGTPREDSSTQSNPYDNGTHDSGAVVLIRRTGTELAYLKGTTIREDQRLGWSVDIDGDRVIAGAPGLPTMDGAAVVWLRLGSVWSQAHRFAAPSGTTGSFFGAAVSIFEDTVAIAAPSEASGTISACGAVYIYRQVNGTWVEEAVIRAPAPEYLDAFGSDISLGRDVIAIGARGDDSAATGITSTLPVPADNDADPSGAVYIFRRQGTNWQFEAYLKASNTGISDDFGRALDLHNDVLVVGALGESSNGSSQIDESVLAAGAAYVFRNSGTQWVQEAYLKAPSPGVGHFFGADVAVQQDTVAISALEDGGLVGPHPAGSVHLFTRNGGQWTAVQRLHASNGDSLDAFGQSVAFFSEGLAVSSQNEAGSPGPNDNNQPGSGAVYVFR